MPFKPITRVRAYTTLNLSQLYSLAIVPPMRYCPSGRASASPRPPRHVRSHFDKQSRPERQRRLLASRTVIIHNASTAHMGSQHLKT
ncbi:hypothetical protein VTO73DRAFT_476 [Trametes versicolor]